ncbi:hypothetical protein T02_14531 [Trichinella nativa]|uniref:Uncharacterized protein n=1 Tax=Trichinella nativa TaxID=6335 RepID=A0A0V1KJQ5_9BILA|nr:hypothetical protein T02_14531 [Trichinella nativa]
MRSKCAITKISTHFAHYRNGLHHQHPARLYSCVSLGWLNGVTQYWSRNLCGFAYHRRTMWIMSSHEARTDPNRTWRFNGVF